MKYCLPAVTRTAGAGPTWASTSGRAALDCRAAHDHRSVCIVPAGKGVHPPATQARGSTCCAARATSPMPSSRPRPPDRIVCRGSAGAAVGDLTGRFGRDFPHAQLAAFPGVLSPVPAGRSRCTRRCWNELRSRIPPTIRSTASSNSEAVIRKSQDRRPGRRIPSAAGRTTSRSSVERARPKHGLLSDRMLCGAAGRSESRRCRVLRRTAFQEAATLTGGARPASSRGTSRARPRRPRPRDEIFSERLADDRDSHVEARPRLGGESGPALAARTTSHRRQRHGRSGNPPHPLRAPRVAFTHGRRPDAASRCSYAACLLDATRARIRPRPIVSDGVSAAGPAGAPRRRCVMKSPSRPRSTVLGHDGSCPARRDRDADARDAFRSSTARSGPAVRPHRARR